MRTFDGYEVKTSKNEDGPTIWWDGQRIRASKPQLLQRLKQEHIPIAYSKDSSGLQYSDGEDFFDHLPMLYKNGYKWLERVKVNEKGEKVK